MPLFERRILLLRSQLASDELGELLKQAGAKLDNIPVYTVVAQKSDCTRLAERISRNEIDWLTFATPSSARSFFEQIRCDLVNSSRAKVASIGPVTSGQLKDLGVRIDIEASEHTIDGLLAALKGVYQ